MQHDRHTSFHLPNIKRFRQNQSPLAMFILLLQPEHFILKTDHSHEKA